MELPTTKPLFAEDLVDLCKIDEDSITKSLGLWPKDSKPAVALVPDLETMQWHHAREEFVGQELHGKVPKVKGAIVDDGTGKRLWCYWTRVWYNEDASIVKGNTMHILRLVVEDDILGLRDISEDDSKAVAALLAHAQREAEEWKTEHVEIWNPSPSALAGAQLLDKSAKVIYREAESIASLLWYPEHEGAAADHVNWLSNEKYGWC